MEFIKEKNLKPDIPTVEYKRASTSEKSDIEVGLARFFCQNYHIITTPDDTIWFYCKDGTYTKDGAIIISRAINDFLGTTETTHSITEILSKIRHSTRTLERYEELFFNKKGEEVYDICVENGILNLKTGELKDHTPNEHFCTKILIKFDKTANCDKIEKFLKEITADGNKEFDEKKYNHIIEIIGWCLRVNEYKPQKCVVFIGDGSNGKSVLLSLIKKLLGIRNVCSISIHQMQDDRFARFGLFGMMANIYADLEHKAIEDTGLFNMLTGDDTVDAERKFKEEVVKFHNRAKMLFSCNIFPRLLNKTTDTVATYRRLDRTDFLHKFLPETGNCNPNLLDEISTPDQLSGLLNLAIKGAQQLILKGSFRDELTIEENRRAILSISDVVQLFAEEAIIEKTGETLTRKEMYLLFRAYCGVTRTRFLHDTKTQSQFTGEFKHLIEKKEPEQYIWLSSTQHMINNMPTQVWINIAPNFAKFPLLEEIYDRECEAVDMEERVDQMKENRKRNEAFGF